MTNVKAWDTHSETKLPRREVNAAGERTWFNWTQFPDHGPGAEVLAVAPGAAVLDLGCGKGGNLAHVATLGARAVGVDVSPAQLQAARERWGALEGIEFHQRAALDFLTDTGERFDAVFFVFGAVWFTEPSKLLPAVRDRLKPGGVLVFSQRPPVEGCYGAQASYINRPQDEDPLVVKRWDYEPGLWVDMLHARGFARAEARVLDAPEGSNRTGTLLVRCAAPA